MIIVTGATGQLGSAVVDRLLDRLPADRVGVSVRRPDRAAGLAARGVRVRRGDYGDPASMATALEGADRVLLVSASPGATVVQEHVTALRAARDAGVERVFYTGHQGASATSPFAPMRDHAATEEQIRALGVTATVLHHGFYADLVPALIGAAVETGELVAPEDGPVSWTARADLARAAALLLTAERGQVDVTPPLTAPDLLDMADVAALLSGLTGRPVHRVVVSDDDWVRGAVAGGVPDQVAEMLVGVFRAARRGDFAVTDPALEQLLGRPATPLRSVLEQALPAA